MRAKEAEFLSHNTGIYTFNVVGRYAAMHLIDDVVADFLSLFCNDFHLNEASFESMENRVDGFGTDPLRNERIKCDIFPEDKDAADDDDSIDGSHDLRLGHLQSYLFSQHLRNGIRSAEGVSAVVH